MDRSRLLYIQSHIIIFRGKLYQQRCRRRYIIRWKRIVVSRAQAVIILASYIYSYISTVYVTDKRVVQGNCSKVQYIAGQATSRANGQEGNNTREMVNDVVQLAATQNCQLACWPIHILNSSGFSNQSSSVCNIGRCTSTSGTRKCEYYIHASFLSPTEYCLFFCGGIIRKRIFFKYNSRKHIYVFEEFWI